MRLRRHTESVEQPTTTDRKGTMRGPEKQTNYGSGRKCLHELVDEFRRGWCSQMCGLGLGAPRGQDFRVPVQE